MKKVVFCGIACLAFAVNAYYSHTEETIVRTYWECTWCGHTYIYEDTYYRSYEWNNRGIIYWIGDWMRRIRITHSCPTCGTRIGWDNMKPKMPSELVEENDDAHWYNLEIREKHSNEIR